MLMKLKYSTQVKGPKAMGRGLDISPKRAKEVADAIRGMEVAGAKRFLEDVIEKKRPVPYRKFNRKISHQKSIGSGAYPVKTAEAFLKVLKNAESNSESEKLMVSHVSANRGRPQRGRRKGSPSNTQITHLQMVLGEK